MKDIFSIQNLNEFKAVAIAQFKMQYANNLVYQKYCKLLGKSPVNVTQVFEIPFLPISFFKSHQIITGNNTPNLVFESSGTTGTTPSKHYVTYPEIYQLSYLKAFETNYGNINDLCILALLPAYLERSGSSLVHMVNDLINKSKHPLSGFYLNNLEDLHNTVVRLRSTKTKVILIGVSFALLDFAEQFPMHLSDNFVLMETGGMKGRRKELIREELHSMLKNAFGLSKIHSEYGMTELLSQAYSKGDGIFNCPPWMKVLVRDTEDPLSIEGYNKTGGINVIDLANLNSCSFIATQDLGKCFEDGSFEILGRFDHSDIRGCNLMAL